MYIITKNRIINSDLVALFSVEMTYGASAPCDLRAYCSARANEGTSLNSFLIKAYSTEVEARTALDRILNGLLNGEKVIDLR